MLFGSNISTNTCAVLTNGVWSKVQFIRVQDISKLKNLAGDSSSDKVGAEAHIGRVGETEGGGSHRVDRVGGGKGSKVVVPGRRV